VSRPERQFPRFALEAEITITGDGIATRGRTSNVSRGGICATVAGALPRGAQVEVSMVLVFAEDSFSEPLTVPARVVWSTPFDDQHQLGLSFRPLSPDQLHYLAMFLRFLEDGAATTRSKTPTKRDPFES
jgi:hypothetical protein